MSATLIHEIFAEVHKVLDDAEQQGLIPAQIRGKLARVKDEFLHRAEPTVEEVAGDVEEAAPDAEKAVEDGAAAAEDVAKGDVADAEKEAEQAADDGEAAAEAVKGKGKAKS